MYYRAKMRRLIHLGDSISARWFWRSVCAAVVAVSLGDVRVAAAQPTQGRSVRSSSGTMEDRIFDAHRTTPTQLLLDLYATHRVLILAFTSHDNTTQYAMLDSVLQHVGHDPDLKLIALERPIESARILQETSLRNIDTAAFQAYFPNAQSLRISLGQPEWVYTFTTVMPRIRALNATRSATNPVRVTTIDDVSVANGSLETVAEGESRETGTSRNFRSTIWDKLAPTDKAILLYHMAHVTKTFSVLNTGWQPIWPSPWSPDTLNLNLEPDPDELVPSDTAPFGQIGRVPSDWLGTFLRDTPTAESKIAVVLLDECVTVGSRVRPALKFTERQALRYPRQPFGVPLAPFRGVLTDSGVSAFATPTIRNHGSTLHSSSAVPAMYDGVIWLPPTADARRHHPYLASVCR